ncbi:MAG: response regulator transcription factor [Polyangiaceae bacterium]
MTPFVVVIGHKLIAETDESVASLLRTLGAEVRVLDLWDDARALFVDDGATARALVVDTGDRPDLAAAILRASRKVDELADVPAILAVPPRQIARVEPSAGFDDFIVVPCPPSELYARLRQLEWRRSEFATEERQKIGHIVVDRAAHEVLVDGRAVSLTAKEFALLSFLAQNRGRVLSRDRLLTRVWGARYEGGPRTVDIHVRRLRMKLGDALPLETLRGAGYKLRSPGAPGEGDEARPRAKGGRG